MKEIGNRSPEKSGACDASSSVTLSFRHHWWFGFGFYLLAIIAGFGDIFSEPHPLPGLLLPFGMYLVLGGWAIADAARRRGPLPALSYGWMIMFAYFVVPVYILHSRGWRGAGWLLLHTVCWLALSAGIALAGQLAAFGELAWEP